MPTVARRPGRAKRTVHRLPDSRLPQLFGSADDASTDAQHLYLHLTSAILICLVAATLVGVVFRSLHQPGGRYDSASLAAAVLLILALGIDLFRERTDAEKTWYGGRAAAESAKTAAWRYAVGGHPFAKNLSAGEAREAFLETIAEIIEELGELTLFPRLGEKDQITSPMEELRKESLGNRIDAYGRERIDTQYTWYARKAKFFRQRRRLWGLVLLGCELGALLLALSRAVNLWDVDLFDVAATAAAAAASWIQTRQYRTLEFAYGIAGEELGRIHSELNEVNTEDDWARFVDVAEGAISREHTLWRAARGARAWQRRRPVRSKS